MKKKSLKETLKHRKKDTKTTIEKEDFEKLLEKASSTSPFSRKKSGKAKG